MKPLEGVRIIDLTVAVAGPIAAHLLGDLGAEVIRVEPPFPRPTAHLDIAPPLGGAPDRPYNRVISFNDLQRSKRSITLDLAKDAGRDALLRLVGVSDAVIENMSPRVLPSLRLAYADMQAVNNRIVLVSMPAFGLDGPLRDRVSYGPGVDAISGMSHLTGYPDRAPMNPANYYCDYNAGLLGAFATLAALRHRQRTGIAQRVELSMLEGELQNIGEALIDYAMNGRIQSRAGNAHPTMAPHGVYRCVGDDRWLAVACEDDAQWHALCGVMSNDELAADARFGDVVSRVRNRVELDAIVESWTSQQEGHAAAEALQAAGVPASACQTVADLVDDAHVAGRGAIQRTMHPEAGEMLHTRAAFLLSDSSVGVARPAPLFAQDNVYVFKELLGMTDAELASLRAARATAEEPGG